MAQIQAQIVESNDAYDQAVECVNSLQAQIDANEQRIDEIEQLLPEVREQAAESMRTLYRIQQTSGGIVNLLLSSDDFYELLTTIQYLDVIQSHNNDAVNELVVLTTELEQTRSSLDLQMDQAEDERANAEDALDEAIAAREKLEAEMAARAAAEEAARQAALKAAAEQAAQQAQAEQSAAPDNSAEDTTTEAEDDATGSDAPSAPESSNESESTPPTFNTETGGEAQIEVPESPDAGSVDWNSDKENFISSWGARIDAYLAGSPLAGQGRTFAAAAWEYGCDPRFSPAIAMVESSLGRVCFRPHNAWGWGSSSWGSWEEAIWDHVAGLASGYGGHLTYAGAQKYCPPNADAWYSSVLANMERI